MLRRLDVELVAAARAAVGAGADVAPGGNRICHEGLLGRVAGGVLAGGRNKRGDYDPAMAFADDLRDCLSEILGSSAPEVPGDSADPVRFFRQWLAERNLGLVP